MREEKALTTAVAVAITISLIFLALRIMGRPILDLKFEFFILHLPAAIALAYLLYKFGRFRRAYEGG